MTTLTANEIFRDYNTDGVPASGGFKPVKADIREYLTDRVENAAINTITIFNVVNYGATGDGITDDGPAIQDAIDACYAAPRGGQVYFPSPTVSYLLGTQVTVPKTAGKQCHLFGDGMKVSVIEIDDALSTSGGAFAIGSATAAGGCGITMADLGFTGADTKKAIHLTNANIFRAERCRFAGLSIGIQAESSYFVQLRDNEFDQAALYGFVTTTTAHGFEATGNGFYGVDNQCIYFTSATASDNIKILGNDFETFGTGFQFDGPVRSLLVQGNYMEYGANALWSFGAASYGVDISNNWLALSANTPLDNCTSGRFADNVLSTQIISAGTAGAQFQDAGGNRDAGSSTLPTLSVRLGTAGVQTAIGFNAARTSAAVNILLDALTAGNNASVAFRSASVTKWEMGKDGSDNFFYYDNVGGRNVMVIVAGGDMSLMPAGGAVSLPTGHLKFPATANPSADANTLDDYEEGTFTPTVIGTGSAGAGTYSVQVGHYTKIGDRVMGEIELVWSAHTGTTNMKVAALPFTQGARKSVVGLSYSNLTFAASVHGYVEASATTIALFTSATGAGEAALPIDTAATLRVSFNYSVN